MGRIARIPKGDLIRRGGRSVFGYKTRSRGPIKIKEHKRGSTSDRPKYFGQWTSMQIRVVPRGTQVAFVKWAREVSKDSHFAELRNLIWLPTTGERGGRLPLRAANEGLELWYPSLFLPVSRCGYPGIFFEMKSPANSVDAMNKERFDGATRLIKSGYGYLFTDSFALVKMFTIAYFSEGKNTVRALLGKTEEQIRKRNSLGTSQSYDNGAADDFAPDDFEEVDYDNEIDWSLALSVEEGGEEVGGAEPTPESGGDIGP